MRTRERGTIKYCAKSCFEAKYVRVWQNAPKSAKLRRAVRQSNCGTLMAAEVNEIKAAKVR